MSIDFCHIVPTPHLPLVHSRPVHLALAHLVEEDEGYADFYRNCNGEVILDNSAFEMYKRCQPMYPTEKLIDMALKVGADYLVLSDYPKEPAKRTMDAALEMIPQCRDVGIGTFFCPQAEAGDLEGLIASYGWAFHHPGIDYVAFSILNIPIAYGCEMHQVGTVDSYRMQKFLSRWKFMREINKRFDLKSIKQKGKKFHFLGMTEGPNEICLVQQFVELIDTWDSSAAVWAGLNGIRFDSSPTGLNHGKFDKEVDFDFLTEENDLIDDARYNMEYIDNLCGGRTW